MRRDRPGKVIAGRYELLEPAGEGGMAVVWRAMVRGAGRFERPVALKRIHAAKNADQHMVKLFEEEARVGAGLQHPNVVQILDFGVDDEGDYYLAMEWIEGLDLHHWARSHPRGIKPTPWPLVTAIGVETLRGLAAAHDRVDAEGRHSPVYHRDVSPSNVLLGTNGTVKLTDFGLARAMDRASMTRPNVIKGKLAYCAPELITGEKASAQSDLFAVGVVLWETLAQQRLFTGKNDLEVLLSVRKGEITRLDELRLDLPAPLVLAVHQALQPAPGDRFEDAKAMARSLAAILRTHPEPVDAEPLGRSVREARERLGMAKRLRQAGRPDAAKPAEPSVQDLSLSDVEVLDPEPSTVDVDISVQDVEPPRSAPVRGLWADDPDD
ncbi:MAG TPA: serine/threonine-protein kinase [Sandaracinaceae bacterium LLY-WYZ-13_1]|nr:serine/threonine-protein kinase [Sandaracinaceae bacterium LLY-WYZ-13_1]